MKKLLIAAAIPALAACGKDEAPKPIAVTPKAEIVAPATPKPDAKAPEAPQPDPNKELASRVKRALEQADLIGIDPNPEKIKFGMPVDVVFKDALGRKDREGNSYTRYFFQPARA